MNEKPRKFRRGVRVKLVLIFDDADKSWVVSKLLPSSWTSGLPPSEMTPSSIFIRIALAKFGVIGLGRGTGDTGPPLTYICETTPATGVYVIDEAGYTNPPPAADDEEPDDDPPRGV
jgi:hypothetical protein